MGQPAQMLSGGESQRLKLVKHLLKSYKGHTLYFLDEPTVGLHPDDINRLLNVLKVFLEKGDTILMIEHDEDLLQFADKVIELDNGAIVSSKRSSEKSSKKSSKKSSTKTKKKTTKKTKKIKQTKKTTKKKTK